MDDGFGRRIVYIMKVITVSEFVRAVSDYLEQGLGVVGIQGEVSGFRVSKSRLVYFELKDESSRVLCFAIKDFIDIDWLEDGQEIRLLGVPKLFKGSGGFHVHVREIELMGSGALHKRFELLMKKLKKEGLFDERHKRLLPRFPESIGLITSHDAAAYKDVLSRLSKRWSGLTIKHAHVKVQGLGSASEIVSAIEYFNKHNPVDVLILTRGGGSMEDLQSFNDERVARAVFASGIPIIVGVGHERDITLAELVADARASTPTNAADISVPFKSDIIHKIDLMTDSMSGKIDDFLREGMDDVIRKVDGIESWLLKLRDRVNHNIKMLNKLSPRDTMKRGYTITVKNGKVVTRPNSLKRKDKIKTVFLNGEIESEII